MLDKIQKYLTKFFSPRLYVEIYKPQYCSRCGRKMVHIELTKDEYNPDTGEKKVTKILHYVECEVISRYGFSLAYHDHFWFSTKE